MHSNVVSCHQMDVVSIGPTLAGIFLKGSRRN